MLSDDQIKNICENEIEDAQGLEGDLASERTRAMDRYLGSPMGDEKEGRSQVVTREVLDTIEWVLPQLIRIFTDVDTAVTFQAVSQEDEDAAEQETDAINHIFWELNPGYLATYSWFKDALLSKNGILKVWWDDSETEERSEYAGLDDQQLAELIFDESVEREVLEYDQDEDGHNIVFKVTKSGRIAIENCPPEEFGVNSDMRTPDVQKARFAFHRSLKTASELIQMGYDREVVDALPWGDDSTDNSQTLARRNLSDERDFGRNSEFSLKTLWYTECYVRLDRDDDGIAELLQVVLATGHDARDSGSTLLSVEEFDHIPFVSITPIMLTHKFYGLSLADMATDLQEIKTNLTRNILDNIYHVNNKEKVLDDELVNLDDAQESRPGGIIRADTQQGRIPLANIVMPLMHQPLGADVYNLLEYLDGERKSRTGVGDEVAALDPGKLANVNTGVAAIAYDAARAKIELIARNFAELGFRPLFMKMHELMRKHADKPMTMRLRNEWTEVKPNEWRQRENLRINVGMGQASRERRMMALESILQKQQLAAQMGGIPAIVGPQHIYSALADYTDALGLKEPTRYWQDPETFQPPPKQPTPEEQMLQMQFAVEKGKLQLSAQKNQVEMMKAKSAENLEQMKGQLQQAESSTRLRLEHLNAELSLAKTAQESANQQERLEAEFKEKVTEREIRTAELQLKAQQEDAAQKMEQYKADLESSTKIMIERLKLGDEIEEMKESRIRETLDLTQEIVAQVRDQVSAEIGNIRMSMEADKEESRKPKGIVRDDDGRIVEIGGKRVMRDLDGKVVQVGEG